MEKIRQQSINDGSATELKLKEDLEQIATIYFNLYLSAVSEDKKEKAQEYNMKHREINV